ncbi:TPA: hypothetical protein ACT910_004701, partial [Enterobacter hormaechei subsp. steigerwaltii]
MTALQQHTVPLMQTFTQKLSVALLLCASLSGVTTMSYAETR